MLKTKFWKDAAASLPAHVRARHIGDIERAERWELALDRALKAGARVRNAFTARFQTPRGAH
jgi:hypothetical protein